MLPESSSRPLPATLAQSRNLAPASLETAVLVFTGNLLVAVLLNTWVLLEPETP